jgi:hypothetical protein
MDLILIVCMDFHPNLNTFGRKILDFPILVDKFTVISWSRHKRGKLFRPFLDNMDLLNGGIIFLTGRNILKSLVASGVSGIWIRTISLGCWTIFSINSSGELTVNVIFFPILTGIDP